jgi:hypothetical protein
MTAVDLDDLEVAAEAPAPEPVLPPEDWRYTKQGKAFVGRRGNHGIIYRRGDEETVEQARVRDALPAEEKRPRRRTKTPKMPEAPRKVDLKELEHILTEAFRQPAIVCAMRDDQWGADHFTTTAPYLARNLIVASEYNPWLRRKLEEAATGQDAAMKIVGLVPVAGALFMYVVPPIIYWFNLPVAEQTRARFGIPPRRQPDYAATPTPSPPSPAAGDGAAFADAA